MKQQIHTSLLTCENRPDSGLLRTYGPLTEDEMTRYFELLHDVLNCWYDTVGQFAPPDHIDYVGYQKLLNLMKQQFEKVVEEDEPTAAYKERKVLRGLLAKFDSVTEEMAMPFTGPRSIREFYINLSARLNYTYDYITGSDI